MNIRVTLLAVALISGFIWLSSATGSPLYADIFGSEQYDECANEMIAIELKQKYCQRDLRDAENQIQYVASQFEQAKIKLENEIAKLQSSLADVQAEKRRQERIFNNEISDLLSTIATLNSQIEKQKKQIELVENQMEQRETELNQKIADRANTIQILKKDSSQKEQSLLNDIQLLQNRYDADIMKAKVDLIAEKKQQVELLEAQRNSYEIKLITAKQQSAEQNKELLDQMDDIRRDTAFQISEKQKLLTHAQTMVDKLKDIIRNREAEIAKLRRRSEAQKEELERMLSQEKELAKQLQSEIEKGEIRLKKLQGKLIINIDNRISYESGSSALKTEIKSTISKIAEILVSYPENQIQIEGHTDNQALKKGLEFKDNWQLSTARALSVLRYLLENEGLDKKRFSVVGYGEHNPIASNETPEGRALNRRVDIVVVPRISQ